MLKKYAILIYIVFYSTVVVIILKSGGIPASLVGENALFINLMPTLFFMIIVGGTMVLIEIFANRQNFFTVIRLKNKKTLFQNQMRIFIKAALFNALITVFATFIFIMFYRNVSFLASAIVIIEDILMLFFPIFLIILVCFFFQLLIPKLNKYIGEALIIVLLWVISLSHTYGGYVQSIIFYNNDQPFNFLDLILSKLLVIMGISLLLLVMSYQLFRRKDYIR